MVIPTPIKAFIAVNLLGAGVAAAALMPALQPAETQPTGRAMVLRGAAVDIDRVRLRVPIAAEAFAEQARARLEQTLRFVGPSGAHTFTFAELGGRVLPADDLDGHRALLDRGWLLASGSLTFEGPGGDRPRNATFALDAERLRDVIGALASRVELEPRDARWDFSADRVIPHRVGRRLEREATARAALEAFALGRPEVPLVITPLEPRVHVERDLGDYEPTVQMATFTTPYNRRKRNRVTNLRLAATAIDGTILRPGDTFSYNDTVGERSEALGWKEAPVIVRGEVMEGIGGGACQISSTLHAASLFGGMDIVERYNHSLPSKYIGPGLDSVVTWPYIDLKVRNPYDFPVILQIVLNHDEGEVRADVWGLQEPRRVILRREIDDIPFKEDVTVDPTLEPGSVRVRRRGHEGMKVRRGLIVWEEDEEDFVRLNHDVYIPQVQRVHIGPETVYPPVPEEELGAPPDTVE